MEMEIEKMQIEKMEIEKQESIMTVATLASHRTFSPAQPGTAGTFPWGRRRRGEEPAAGQAEQAPYPAEQNCKSSPILF
jgi:hypothetical protein